jgi:hypothetical protein
LFGGHPDSKSLLIENQSAFITVAVQRRIYTELSPFPLVIPKHKEEATDDIREKGERG